MQINEHLQACVVLVVVDQPSFAAREEPTSSRVRGTYRGLSGISAEPAARRAPITHCMNKGIRQDKSESMNEQK